MSNIAKTCLLIYLLLKPFYIFGSGGIQVADLFLLIGSLSLFINLWLSRKNRNILQKTMYQNKYLLIFILLTFIINGFYFLSSYESKFLLSSIYYVFSLIAVLAFLIFFKEKGFVKRVGSVLKANLVIQLALWLGGIGRYYDTERYMGTFNDPNQFAFFVILSFLFIYIIDVSLGLKRTWFFYLLAVTLIIQSSSTAMLLGMGVFAILFAGHHIRLLLRTPYNLVRKVMGAVSIVLILTVPLLAIFLSAKDEVLAFASKLSSESSVISRFEGKAEQASGEADVSIIEDRGLDTIIYYPHYLLYGAGEGGYHRFDRIHNYGNEIHSSLPSIFFNYGFVPFLIIIFWIASKLKGIDKRLLMAAWVLFIVSFFLLVQRQALFWIFIAVLPILSTYIKPAKGNAETI